MNNEVFDPCILAGIKLKNRIIRSATHEGVTDENSRPDQQLIDLYVSLAKGEVGAIITGFAVIQPNGRAPLHKMLAIDDDACIASYKRLTEAVHQYNTPIIIQLAHCGRQTRSKITGLPTVAPSSLRDKFYDEEIPKELSEKEIEELINNFVNGVIRAKAAGFDGAQLHLAHGYLLSEFLSPYMNQRQDRWGGNTENRFRIIAEIFKRAKEKTGDFPILVKLNAYDNRKNGMRVEEAIKIAKLLQQSGCAAIEVSCGVFEDGLNSARSEKNPIPAILKYNFKFERIPNILKPMIAFFVDKAMPPAKPMTNYNVEAAFAIKQQVSIPVIAVGGIGSVKDISVILGNKKADFVSMCRPFIIEPDIVKKFKEGKQISTRCVYCNYCTIAQEKEPIRCFYGKLK
jgi:2,4-dienoyl-CoA reductase-like NADH-dependent reductase (Old Yellow Enzyme family)